MSQKKNCFVPSLDVLEDRTLMTANVTASLLGRVLTVDGTDRGDKIWVVRDNNTIKVNTWVISTSAGASNESNGVVTDDSTISAKWQAIFSDSYSKVDKIIVNGFDGNDEIRLDKGGDIYQKADLYGDNGDDLIVGGKGQDSLHGWSGGDSLYGYDGNDYIHGSYDNDYLSGGEGSDTLYGWTGNDTIYGGGGNDSLYGWTGNDTIYGGAGNDYLSGYEGSDYLNGGTGKDTFQGDSPDTVVRDLTDFLGQKKLAGSNPNLKFSTKLDLNESAVADEVEDFLDDLAWGNEGSASVDSLQIDLQTGDVSGTFTLRHRHNWGRLFGLAYDTTMDGDFRYNVYSSDISGKVVLGSFKGYDISFRIEDLYKVMKGDLSGLITAAAGFRQESNYNATVSSYQNAYGKANVYFASKSFADWAGPETLLRWGAEAIATEGASLAKVPAEVAKYLTAEGKGIASWLNSRVESPEIAKQLADKIVDALVSRKNISTPYFDIKWTKLDYWYASNMISGLRTQKISHYGYAIILKV